MKFNRHSMLLGAALLATTVLVTSCAKAPEEEVTAATNAIQAALTAEADKYAPDTYRAAQDSLEAAKAEIQAQSSKFALFRKYDRAKALIASAQSTAARAQSDAAVNKEAARVAAEEALTMATAAVDSAKTMLAKAPVGKDNKADIEMMQGDLQGAEANLEAVRQAIAQQDYLGARAQAQAINDKAMQIVNDVHMAMEKTGGRR